MKDVPVGSNNGQRRFLMRSDALISPKEWKDLARVGYRGEQEHAGSFLVADERIVESNPLQEQVELRPLAEAIQADERVRQLVFHLIDPHKDVYTQMVNDQPEPLGYFIRVRQGQEVSLPLQTCFYIHTNQTTQRVHNIVVAEPGAVLHLISGCATSAHVEAGCHIGVTEYYIGEGASITSTMIHSWGPEIRVYPRAAAQVGKGGRFISNYIAMSPVKELQMAPVAEVAAGGLAEFYSIVYAPLGANLDIGGMIRLQGDRAKADIVSRVVSDGGRVTTRGCIVGEVDGVQGAMACNGLLVNPGGYIHAIPELEGHAPLVLLSHEASVGMISQEELCYLMASGLSEEAARELIIQGFLDVRSKGLPEYLVERIREMIRQTKARETV
ncbi:MAG: SufD family Fe-S cluster assembly protein [Desulfobulbus sp.]|nr:SufD family Fe-S cluster assembly protein [Desulfobulbus sp.]